MRKEYRIKLYSAGKFSHNIYITCEKLIKNSDTWLDADGVKIDTILSIGEITENS